MARGMLIEVCCRIDPEIAMATVACNRGTGRRDGPPFPLYGISRKRYTHWACILSGLQLCLSRVPRLEPAVTRLCKPEHDTGECLVV